MQQKLKEEEERLKREEEERIRKEEEAIRLAEEKVCLMQFIYNDNTDIQLLLGSVSTGKLQVCSVFGRLFSSPFFTLLDIGSLNYYYYNSN